MGITAILSALGSAAGGYLASRGSDKETKMQRTKRKLVDQVLASLQGQGPFSNLYDFSEEAFNKSFVEPAKQKFSQQIAPQIRE